MAATVPGRRGLWAVARKSMAGWSDDRASSMGAAIAYYTLFSVAPLLLIIIAVAGMVFGEEAARGQIFSQIRGLVGEDGAAAMEGLVQSGRQPAQGTLAIIISVGAMLIGATAVFGELQASIDRIWRAPVQKRSGLVELVRNRMLAFGMVLGIAFLMIVSLVASAAISALGSFWRQAIGGWEPLLQLVNIAVSIVLFTVLFALIFRYLPRARVDWQDVWIGAAVTALLFTIGKFLIGLYIGKSSVASAFGAAGSLVTVLVWVYYSAQVFLLGAEFTWAYANTYGSLSRKPGA